MLFFFFKDFIFWRSFRFKAKLSGRWTYLVVQWLRFQTSTAGDVGSIPGWGSSACRGVWPKKKIEWKMQRSPTHPLPPLKHNLPPLPTSPTFIPIGEPTLKHHCHPKSTVYITVQSWCCAVYEFGQMYNDMHPSL